MEDSDTPVKFSVTYLKKRELVAYYLLCREPRIWNTGEAVDFLVKKLCMNTKTAYNVLRRLRRLGLLRYLNELSYECVRFNEYMDRLVEEYSSARTRRGCA